MSFPHHLGRLLLTLLGFAAFLLLAFGSNDGRSSTSGYDYSPSPEVVGQETAMTWARSKPSDLARKIHQVELRRSHAQQEISKLETMREQFPGHATKIAVTIKEWQVVLSELDSALAAVTRHVSAAYVAHHSEGRDRDVALGEVYSKWSPQADQALALAKKQWAKSGD